MLVLVTAAAVTCFSLLYANPWLADAYFTLCIAMLALGIVAAIARRGDKRAFWMGFVIISAAYLWLALSPYGPTMSEYAQMLSDQGPSPDRAHLLTSRLLIAGYQQMEDVPMFGPAGYSAAAYTARFAAFMVVGHSSLALLAGWLGGILATHLYRSNGVADRDEKRSA